MTPFEPTVDPNDGVFRMLARLEAPEPSAMRARRVIDRCQHALTRRERWRQRRQEARRQFVETSVVGGLALVFVVGMILDLVRWQR